MTTLTSPSPTIPPQPSSLHGSTRSLSTTLRRPPSPQASFPQHTSSSSSSSSKRQQQLRSSASSSRLNASPTIAVVEPAPAVTAKQQSVDAGRVDSGTQYTPPGYPPTARRLQNPLAAPAPLIDSAQLLDSTRQLPKPTTKRRTPEEAKEPPPEPSLRQDPTQPQPRDPASSTPAVKTTTAAPSIAGAASETSPQKRARPYAPMEKLLPQKYAECDVADLGFLISDMLMDLVRINDKIPLKDGSLTRFHSRAPPGISVKDYLNRLIVHATLSPPILLSMVYYIDRLCVLYPGFTISSLTVHRFLIAAATVAAKGLSDSFWTNNTYARVGGVSVKELALLELDFLEKMQWRIVPPPEVLDDYYRSLVERNPGYRLAND